MKTASLLAYIASLVGPSMAISTSSALKETLRPERVWEWGQQYSATSEPPGSFQRPPCLPPSSLLFFSKQCVMFYDVNMRLMEFAITHVQEVQVLTSFNFNLTLMPQMIQR